jgi:glycosyltransferase involved in cell wall biosynthesis
VSVVVPTYNEEAYLPKLLECLRGQNCEILVVDGGSTDTTRDVANKFHTRLIVASGARVGAARNYGARFAKHGIVGFLDADTLIPKNWVEQVEDSFRDSNVVFVAGATYPQNGNLIDHSLFYFRSLVQRFSVWLGVPYEAGMNCAYRKEVFRKVEFNNRRESVEGTPLQLHAHQLGRLAYNPRLRAYVSLRRAREWGWIKLLLFHVSNWLALLLVRRTWHYPKIR